MTKNHNLGKAGMPDFQKPRPKRHQILASRMAGKLLGGKSEPAEIFDSFVRKVGGYEERRQDAEYSSPDAIAKRQYTHAGAKSHSARTPLDDSDMSAGRTPTRQVFSSEREFAENTGAYIERAVPNVINGTRLTGEMSQTFRGKAIRVLMRIATKGKLYRPENFSKDS